MSNTNQSTWSPIIKQLIKAAEAKSIHFRWASSAEMDSKIGKNCLGFYNPRLKVVVVRKGLNVKQTEEVITHEVAHALWDLSLSSFKVKRGNLKKMKIKTSIPTWLNLILNYKWNKKIWKEEQFAFYMQSKPSLILHLFNQL